MSVSFVKILAGLKREEQMAQEYMFHVSVEKRKRLKISGRQQE